MKAFDRKNFLVDNEIQVNQTIGRLLYLACLIGPTMYVMTQFGIFQIEASFCLIFTGFSILTCMIQQILVRFPQYHSVARFFGIFALEILIGVSATRASIGIYLSYGFATLLSCLYVRLSYTRLVCIVSYVVMMVAMYFRSFDQVAHHFIKETQMEYFIKYTAGFTIEFVVLYVISQTIVEYEEKLLKGQEEELVERLEAQEENKAKSVFLAQMSHEIRTPINAVLGMNEMILRQTEQPEIEGYARTVKNAGKTLLTIINDILDFSKIQSGRMEIVPTEYDAAGMIQDLIELYRVQAQAKGLEFLYQVADDLPCTLSGDNYRIKQAAGNLLSNAIKYTENGFVSLQVTVTREEDEHITMVLSVIDSGIGIKSEDIPKLFQDFGRLDVERNRAIEGTGLGLKISKQLVEMMGGTLTVQSVYGEGSIFSITVDQAVCSNETVGEFSKELERREKETIERSVGGKTVLAENAEILVVDDNEMNLQVVSSLLKKSRCRVECVRSGEECLGAVRKKHYDLILLDHMMPKMDGIETLKILREKKMVDERTPIVVLTANAIAGAKDNYLEEGFDDYISKPIAIEELDRVLMEHLPASKIHLEEKKTVDVTACRSRDLSMYGIDLSVGMHYMEDDEDIYREMATVFIEDYEKKLQSMKEALEKGDMPEYSILVHGLKSNARTLGANRLGELAFVAEKESKAGDIPSVQKHMGDLEAEWQMVRNGLEQFVKNREAIG
ncbi:MAG: response regulator [Lachnospiraceae bacterium]